MHQDVQILFILFSCKVDVASLFLITIYKFSWNGKNIKVKNYYFISFCTHAF